VLAAQPGGGEVGGDDPVPNLGRGLQGGAVARVHGAGVVVDHIDAAKLAVDAGIGVPHLALDGEVGDQVQRADFVRF